MGDATRRIGRITVRDVRVGPEGDDDQIDIKIDG